MREPAVGAVQEVIKVGSFENEQDSVAIASFRLIRVDRSIIHRDEIASLDVLIAGCRFEAWLSLGGSLRLPCGVSIPDDLQQRATEFAQQQAIAEIPKAWSRPRGSGEAR
jgi:hypothetical protein